MLEINNYSNYILKDISLNIDKNIVILGDNGAGKTTLAKVLAGLIKSDNVSLDDINLNNIPYEDRTDELNYIPAKLDIFDDYINVLEYLQLNKFFDKNKCEDILKLLDIEHLKNNSCKLLSSGESQLLLLASAIIHDARYTILDEPTSNLDPQKVQKVFSLLKSNEILHKKIIITHNLNLAFKLDFEIVYIRDGGIKYQGSSKEFFTEDNLHRFYNGSVKIIDDNVVINI